MEWADKLPKEELQFINETLKAIAGEKEWEKVPYLFKTRNIYVN